MSLSLKPAAFRGTLAAVALAAASMAQAAPIVWTITGPGTTTATNTSDVSVLTYNNPGLFSSTQVWEVRGLATEDGDYTYNWEYTGFHSFFRVTAFLNTTEGDTLVSAGPVSGGIAPPSAGFSYSGRYTFSGVTAGSIIGFNMGGNHFDSARTMTGTLTLTVPTPGSAALAGLALVALGAASRRRSA